GKEVGLCNDCFPDILVNDLPNIYVYHVVNASEASIAKRRGYALIINHASPPLTVSSLPDEFLEIDNLIKEYFDFLHDKVKSREISQKVLEKAQKYGLGETVEEVYDRLAEYRRSLIPKGLHVLGEKMSSEEIIDYLTFLSRYDRSEAKSIHRIILESRGIDYNMVLNNSYKGSESCSAILQETDSTVKALLKTYLTDGKLDLYPNVNKAELEKCLTFLHGIYEKVMQSDEINSILNALEGKFIAPGPGGDPIRTPEIYPTGRNTYALDPTRVPTETAMERGKIIAESYLRQFYKKHGKYPKTISFVLWAFETMKTGGETVAAVFHLLGVKPVLKGLYIRDLEVIPIEELKRPRIDVVVTICGIFRDTFYNVVEMLDKAFRLVAELNEPEEMNYVKSNIKKQAQHGEKAAFRIFGPPEGLYATGITSLIETSNWKSEAEIVNAYLDSMKFAYGEKRRNVEAKDFLETLLSNVDLVAQIRDTTEYEITDLDHYYEFLGGLSRAVKEKKGCNPEVYVADTTREIVKIDDVRESIKRGVVTRIINPKWLDAMIEHGFNGVTKIADRVEYMLGLAATLNGVENCMWEKVAEKTIFDKYRNEKMKRANPWAFRKTIEKMLESIKRGYWKADDETIKKLENEYLKIEEILEYSD
ncbi:MAG: cobaltochelatase subunit CobN, partial [Candidatus Bathyarchaeia archaeon]